MLNLTTRLKQLRAEPAEKREHREHRDVVPYAYRTQRCSNIEGQEHPEVPEVPTSPITETRATGTIIAIIPPIVTGQATTATASAGLCFNCGTDGSYPMRPGLIDNCPPGRCRRCWFQRGRDVDAPPVRRANA